MSDQEKEEFVIVEQDPEEDEKELSDGDGGDDTSDDDDDGDERVAATSDDDDDREAIRERRRQEKKDRKIRQEEAKKRDKLELDFLRKRNDLLEQRLNGVETRFQQSDLAALDNQLRDAIAEAELAEKVMAKAMEAQNGEDFNKAMRFRDQAIAKAQQLAAQKQSATQPRQEQQLQQPKPNVETPAMKFAKKFIEKNSWYKPDGSDEDSAIALAVDNSLTREGWDANSETYWEEFEKRLAKRLPEKFQPANSDRKPKGGPQLGSGKEHAPSSTKKEVYISPERKQALIDAGVWDDPILRNRYVKRYMEYDKANRS